MIVRGNRIKNCDYSAVRGNSASNIQITGNSVSDVREVALYSEFSFEGAVIANNTVDGAAFGVSVCNFNEGGRIAVVQGKISRNLRPKRPIGTPPGAATGAGRPLWAEGVSPGDLPREGSDATLTVDPKNLQLLYQGLPRDTHEPNYVLLPYRLALLTSPIADAQLFLGRPRNHSKK